MKKIMAFLIVVLVSTSVQMVPFLPWWSFVIPIFLLGIILPFEKWRISSFQLGFVAGFLVWLLSTLYFQAIYKGEIIDKITKLMEIWNFVIYMLIGSVGGVLTGLALYSGFLLRRGKEVLYLELPKN